VDAVLANLDVFGIGILRTLYLTFWAGLLALVLGTLLAAMRVGPIGSLRIAATGYVTLVRNTPLTLVLFFTGFGLPILQVTLTPDPGLRFRIFAILGLGCYTAAFVCEVLRSGVNTVPVGQAEAARSIGLGFGGVLGSVILPQAFRAVLAPLGSVFIALAKNTSIASAFNSPELLSAVRNVIEVRGDAVIAILLAGAVAYLAISLGLSGLFRLLEIRYRVQT